MRILFATLLLAQSYTLRSEIQDVLKSAEIDRTLAAATDAQPVHEKPNFAVVLRVAQGQAKPPQTQNNVDEVWFVRRGKADVKLGTSRYDVGAGDMVDVPRGT